MFKSLVIFASLLATASAQTISIGYPADDAQVTSGSNITVEVDRPNSLTGSKEVGLVIGMQSCSGGVCEKMPATDYLGALLVNTGDYNPQYNEYYKPPYENYTITVPTYLEKGPARISVTHYALVGASYGALFETKTVNVTIV